MWDSLYYRNEAESLFTGKTHDFVDSIYPSEGEIPIIFGNSGGVTGEIDINRISLCDLSNEFQYYETPGLLTITPGEAVEYDFGIPSVISGTYKLKITGDVEPSGERYVKEFTVNIQGIDASIDLTTDKYFYLPDDSIKTLTLIKNENYPLNGDLFLRITPSLILPWPDTLTPDDYTLFGCRRDGSWIVIDSIPSLYPLCRSQFIADNKNRETKSLKERIEDYLRQEDIRDRTDEMPLATSLYGDVYLLKSENPRVLYRFNSRLELLFEQNFSEGIGAIADIEAKNFIYLSDNDSSLVRIVGLNGNLVGSFGKPSGQFNDIWGIGLGEGNNLWVTERGNSCIWEFSQLGDSLSCWVLDCVPQDVAFSNGYIYVCCGRKLIKFTTSGVLIDSFGMEIADSLGYSYEKLSIDEKGNIYTCGDWTPLLRFSPDGILEAEFYPPSKNSFATGNDSLFYILVDIPSRGFSYISGYEVLEDNKGIADCGYLLMTEGCRITSINPFEQLNFGSINYDYHTSGGFRPISELINQTFEEETWLQTRAVLCKNDNQSPKFGGLEIWISTYQDSTIWADTSSISIASFDSLALYNTIAGINPGNYILHAGVSTSQQQKVDKDFLPFSILSSGNGLFISKDKAVSLPGDTVHITTTVVNLTDSSFDSVHLFLFKDTLMTSYVEIDSVFLDTIFSLQSQDTIPYSFTIAPNSSFFFRGELTIPQIDTIKATEEIRIALPILFLDVESPNIVDHNSFTVRTTIENSGEVSVPFTLSRDLTTIYIDTLFLSPDEAVSFIDTFIIIKPETLTVGISSDWVNDSLLIPVRFGESLEFSIDSSMKLPEDSVSVNYVIENTGAFMVSPYVSLLLRDSLNTIVDSTYREYIIQIGSQYCDDINYYNLNPGYYEIQWLCGIPSSNLVFNEGISHLNVISSSDIEIDTIIVADTANIDSTFFVEIVIKNRSLNTFLGNIELSTPFWESDTILNLIEVEDTIIFTLDAELQEDIYPFQVRVSEGGNIIDSKLLYLSLSPLFRFSEPLQVINAFIEDTVNIIIEAYNVGVTEGEVEIAFEFGDIADVHDTLSLKSREIKEDTIRFIIPEDLPRGEYWAWLYLMGERNLVKVHVEGYGVSVTANLDKSSYVQGDTAHLFLDVENLSYLDAELIGIVNYHDFNEDTSFHLSGSSFGVDFIDSSVTLLNVGGIYSDSGFYLLPTFNFDADSILLLYDATMPPQTSLSFYLRSSQDRKHWENWYEILDSTGYGNLDNYIQLKTILATENPDTTPILHSIILSTYSGVCWADTLIDNFVSPNSVLHFGIPVQTNGSDGKAAYGIYTMSGRSLYLNSIYIYSRNDTLNLTLDKQVYDPGDIVNVTVESIVYGDSVLLTSRIYFTAGEEIIDTISIDSCLTHFFFNVPPRVVASTYNLEYILHVNDTQYLVGERPFDTDGIIGYFLESNLDTNTYSPCDTATLELFIHVNMSFDGNLKGWLKSLGKDMPLVFDTTFALIDTLPNQIEVAFPINLDIQGCAQVVYMLFWDSLPICGGIESFDIFIDDSLPPSIQLIKLPEAGYVSNMPYEVTTVIQDDNPFYDTLYYYIDFLGWTYTEGYNCLGDTFLFSIPPQPNGTEVEYYIAVIDTFGNRTREPTVHNYSFWIHKPLAPNNISISPLETTAVNINWEHPVEEINYDFGTPLESYLLPPGEIGAVRFTPQYYPCHIKNVKLYIQISTGKNVTKFSLNDSERDYEIQVYVFEVDSFGEPGNLLMGPYSAVIDGGCGWKMVTLDSLNLISEEGEFYIGIASSNPQAQIYGDANQTGIMRSRFYDGETWHIDSIIGNILIRAEVEYTPASGKSNSNLIGYQLLRRHQDDSSFVVVQDTITVNTVVDTDLVEETQYFYKINAVYNQPDRIVESNEENLLTDWSPPIFENVESSQSSDTSVVIEAEITDWSGILWDSLYYRNEAESLFTGKTHDFVDSIYYYTVPYQLEDSLFYWLCAVDSSLWLNYARFPDSGYAFYYSPSTGIDEDIPRVFFLSQNFPNPFRGKTVISYQLPVISKVSLKVYDLTGRLVITLVDEEKEAGYYTVKWSGREKNLTSGIYFLRMSAAGFTKTRKIILIQ